MGSLVSQKNLIGIIRVLWKQIKQTNSPILKNDITVRIIKICERNDYQFISNFEWYVTVLVELAQIDGSKHGSLIASQMMDVTIRVDSIRAFSVRQMSLLLQNHHLLLSSQRGCSTDVLFAAAWICGEFSIHLDQPDNSVTPEATLKAMFRGKTTKFMPSHVQSAYIQNGMKLFSNITIAYLKEGDHDKITSLTTLMDDSLSGLLSSSDLEVQERASVMQQFVRYVKKHVLKGDGESLKQDLPVFFSGELNPVASKAQKKVPIPEGLDLDAWINEPLESQSESSEDETINDNEVFVKSSGKDFQSPKQKRSVEPSPKEMQRHREARLLQQQQDPNYLKPKTPTTPIKAFQEEHVPVKEMEFSGVPPLLIPGLATTDQYFDLNDTLDDDKTKSKGKKKKSKDKSKKRSKHRQSSERDESDQNDITELPVFVKRAAEMPEGVMASDGDDDEDRKTGDEDDPHRALRDIDLEGIDENRYKAIDVKTNGRLIDHNNSDEVTTKKKKKHKGEDKSKKKKHKKKDDEKISVSPTTKRHNAPDNDIDLWLEDVNTKPVEDDKSDDIENQGALKSKKEKKKKKKHSKEKKRDRSLENVPMKSPKTQCLVDSNGIKLNCFLQATDNSDEYNVKATFSCENIQREMALNDVEISVEGGQMVSLVEPDPIKMNLAPQSHQKEDSLLKVDSEISTININGSISFRDPNEKEIKMPFTLKISCLDLLIPVTDGLQDLLSAGALKASQNLKKTCLLMTSFKTIMETIDDRTKFASIEKTENGTFLFAKHFCGDHVAIMLKFNQSGKILTIEGKATNAKILTFVMNSVSDLIM